MKNLFDKIISCLVFVIPITPILLWIIFTTPFLGPEIKQILISIVNSLLIPIILLLLVLSLAIKFVKVIYRYWLISFRNETRNLQDREDIRNITPIAFALALILVGWLVVSILDFSEWGFLLLGVLVLILLVSIYSLYSMFKSIILLYRTNDHQSGNIYMKRIYWSELYLLLMLIPGLYLLSSGVF